MASGSQGDSSSLEIPEQMKICHFNAFTCARQAGLCLRGILLYTDPGCVHGRIGDLGNCLFLDSHICYKRMLLCSSRKYCRVHLWTEWVTQLDL